MKMMKKKKNSGFTLMELMIVIAIIAILSGVAIPNFIGFLPRQRLAAGAQDILQGLQKSRSKAIMTNRPVVVNLNAAADSFTAFVDENADGAQDAGELIIAARTMPAGINLTTNLVGAVTAVTFDDQGIPTTSGTMTVQNSSGDTQDIRLYLSGHSVLE